MKQKDVIKDEIIGLDIRVNKFEGAVADETKNMIFIKKNHEIKGLQKKAHVFEIYYKKKWLVVDGKKLVGRPEERIKKVVKND